MTTQQTTKAKRVAKPDWKKNNFIHIRDHGLAMEFADPVKTDYLRSLAGKDGKTVFLAGKSQIDIETVGRVSRVTFFDAIGKGHLTYSIHYFSPAENLKYSLVRTEGNAGAYEVLNVAVFGNDNSRGKYAAQETYAANILRCASGAAQDSLRAWSGQWAWTLSGEAGMRAKALESKDAALASAVREAGSLVKSKADQLENARTRDFRADHSNLRKALARHVDACRAEEKTVREALATSESFFGDAEKVAAYFNEPVEYGFGLYRDEPLAQTLALLGASFSVETLPIPEGGWGTNPNRYTRRIFFPARHATWSHEEISPNYTVSRGEGGSLRLSSGIVCPFDEQTALAWLRGDAPAPQTQYGLCRKISGRDKYGKAIILVACGCHRVDVARDLGGEFAELLKPDFVVTQTSGTPLIDAKANPAEFLARCQDLARERLATLADNMARAVTEYRQRKADLLKTEERNPAYIAELETELTARKQSLADAERAQKNGTAAYPGARLEQINRQNRAALSAFASAKIV